MNIESQAQQTNDAKFLLLAQDISTAISNQSNDVATDFIAQTLQNRTQALSLEIAGKYTPPQNQLHVPRKPRGFNKLWREIKDFAQHWASVATKATGGLSIGMNTQGISGGFTQGNQFQLVTFNKKPKPVIELPAKTPLKIIVESAVASVVGDIPFLLVCPHNHCPKWLHYLGTHARY